MKRVGGKNSQVGSRHELGFISGFSLNPCLTISGRQLSVLDPCAASGGFPAPKLHIHKGVGNVCGIINLIWSHCHNRSILLKMNRTRDYGRENSTRCWYIVRNI